jgi:hypothetical protein
MSTYRTFKTDPGLETSGITIDYGSAGKFRIARAGGSNKRFNKKFAQLTRPHRRAIAAQAMDDDLADGLMMDAFIESSLLGWEGVTGEDGQALEFTKDNARKLFRDLPDLFRDLLNEAQNIALFRRSLLETEAGN